MYLISLIKSNLLFLYRLTRFSLILASALILFPLTQGSAFAGGDAIETSDFSTLLSKAHEGNFDAMYAVALKLLDEEAEGNAEDAFGWALNSARGGHPQGAELTGRFYRLGVGVSRNHVKARKWLLRGASRGSVGSYFELALLFLDEGGPSFDEEQGAAYMEEAIKRGEPRACLVAAEAKIAAGVSVRKVLQELTCAARGGVVSAMLLIADYYESKRSPTSRYQARQWLEKAASMGDSVAVERLEAMK